MAKAVSHKRTRSTRASGVGDKLSVKVYKAMKRDIIRGVHPAGEPLTEKELAKQYKASRTPVREAALRLQEDRLLRIVPNRGYFVSQITLQELTDIYEYRAAVECAAAELAARKATDSELLQKLIKLAETSYQTDSIDSYMEFIEADTVFHVGIARLSRNQMLIRAVNEARCQMERIMYAAIDIHYYGEVPTREHRAIMKAILEHDPEAARRHMYDHIIQSRGKVLRLTGSSGVP
ncbi:MAG: GntR family transcriptional regulator [Acidobacteriia bacterium]|nr:GntR family transcriptional regulator [Terriglobia bacterium]